MCHALKPIKACFRFSEKVLNSQFVDRFPFFWVCFLIFWVRFRFSKKVSNSEFVDRFPLFSLYAWIWFMLELALSILLTRMIILELCELFLVYQLTFWSLIFLNPNVIKQNNVEHIFV